MAIEYLYHYTSLSALQSMLKNTQDKDELVFWASDITMMNDPDELAYGVSKTKEYLSKLESIKSVPKQKRLSPLIKSFSELPNMQLEMARDLPSLYAISFSEDGDSLPMWRTYSDSAKGVCLKVCDYIINTQVIKSKSLWRPDDVNVKITDGIRAAVMCYGEIKEDSSAARLITNKFEEFLKELHDDNQKENTLAFIKIYGGMLVKRPEFQYEKEHRLYDGFKSPRHYRISPQGMLIPYVELPIKKNLIKGIILGPEFNRANEVPLMRMLCDAGLGKISFARSKIHFRNM